MRNLHNTLPESASRTLRTDVCVKDNYAECMPEIRTGLYFTCEWYFQMQGNTTRIFKMFCSTMFLFDGDLTYYWCLFLTALPVPAARLLK